MKNSRSLLMIFVKNPVPGEVKTRLATGIGEKRATAVYRELLKHTKKVSLGLDVHKQVWYAGRMSRDDIWEDPEFKKKLQPEGNLGDKLAAAFSEGFQAGYDRLVCIGSDCLEIKKDHISEAFDKLNSYDIVLGPAGDGGYYLAGMSKPSLWLFSEMPWSTPDLFPETVKRIEGRNTPYTVLPVLNDIDTVEDLGRSGLEIL